MSTPLIEQFVCPSGESPPRQGRRASRPEGLFLRGPVPLEWIVRASGAGGTCLAVGMIIRAYCGMNDERSCRLSHRKIADLLHCSSSSVRKAVAKLIEGGLIECEHRDGVRNEYQIPQ